MLINRQGFKTSLTDKKLFNWQKTTEQGSLYEYFRDTLTYTHTHIHTHTHTQSYTHTYIHNYICTRRLSSQGQSQNKKVSIICWTFVNKNEQKSEEHFSNPCFAN